MMSCRMGLLRWRLRWADLPYGCSWWGLITAWLQDDIWTQFLINTSSWNIHKCPASSLHRNYGMICKSSLQGGLSHQTVFNQNHWIQIGAHTQPTFMIGLPPPLITGLKLDKNQTHFTLGTFTLVTKQRDDFRMDTNWSCLDSVAYTSTPYIILSGSTAL